MKSCDDLIAKIKKYDPKANEAVVRNAYALAKDAHSNQKRASGEPYFTHPIAVAEILITMKLDVASIATALLHDTVEDTDLTLDEIESKFGIDIRKLVDGVTKLSMIKWDSHQHQQAENFRKLVLAMSNDIRVLLVKLSDRLHNMRTLHYVPSAQKRLRKARETMDIYVPLAQRIGMHDMKDELEDLSFSEINPDARDSIMTRLNFLRHEGENSVELIINELQELFKSNKITSEVSGREKTAHSVWKKMRKKNITFEQLADIIAFRVVVDSIEHCYAVLGLLHGKYSVVPGRFKDYISTPKPNHYQSIHTAVMGPRGHRIEIQIRTTEMHEINELGVAAHWIYKQSTKHDPEAEKYTWLRGLLEILDNAKDPEEFLEHTKLEMFQDQVFCFSPKGDLVPLPSGATPIDFAYAVHSEVGNHCVGVKINGRMVPLRTVLKNGDQVEITTSSSHTPSPTWERYAITGKAKSAIRRFIRSQKRDQFEELGRAILLKILQEDHLQLDDKLLSENLSKLGCKSIDDVYAVLGEGLKPAAEIKRLMYPNIKPRITDDQKVLAQLTSAKTAQTDSKKDSSISIKGLIPGMAVHYAGCCHPLPGDTIVGIVITGRGVTIHTDDCDTLERYRDEPDRWLNVSWSNSASAVDQYVTRLRVTMVNKVGSLASMASLIGKNGGNIHNFKIINRAETFYDVMVDVEVQDTVHLGNMMAAMRASTFVNYVERTR